MRITVRKHLAVSVTNEADEKGMRETTAGMMLSYRGQSLGAWLIQSARLHCRPLGPQSVGIPRYFPTSSRPSLIASLQLRRAALGRVVCDEGSNFPKDEIQYMSIQAKTAAGSTRTSCEE